MIHNERQITDAYIGNRVKTLFDDQGYKNYFTATLVGDPQKFAAQAIVTPEELAANRATIRLLHGRNDKAFPPAITLTLAEALPQADVTLLANCSHSIALEQPEKFLLATHKSFGGSGNRNSNL